ERNCGAGSRLNAVERMRTLEQPRTSGETRRCPTAPGDHATECLGVPLYSSLGHSQFLSRKVCNCDCLSFLGSVQFVLLAQSDALHVPKPVVSTNAMIPHSGLARIDFPPLVSAAP